MKNTLVLFTTLLPTLALAEMPKDFDSLNSLGKGAEVVGGVICKSGGSVVLKEVERRSVWNSQKYYLVDELGELLELSLSGSGAGDWSAELVEPDGTPVLLSLSPDSSSVNLNDEVVSSGTLTVGKKVQRVTCYGKMFRSL